ncbi:MAG: carboxypeptidase regulatory-like domain-containing protein [Nanoarchaeota archaeon]|nr:carboxypeptidase regulatory-like domain-containing protein [Nanoarchaeota archaeon]
MGVRFPLLIVLSFFLSLAAAVAAQASVIPGISCADQPGFDTLVCGATPDSALGYGAVDICGACYPCGYADGVCPEDFYADGTGRGSCRFCPDPDCAVTINGTVKDKNGNTVSNAEIVALYEPDTKEVISATDILGNYVGQIRTGFNKLFVRYQDYDSRIVQEDITRSSNGVVKTVDFTGADAIEPGTCSESCTDNFGLRCKASCDGINGCQFANYTVSTLCDDKIAGTRVFLSDDTYITCCEGATVHSAFTERIGDFSGELRGDAEDLITYTQRTRSRGERVDLQVAVWNTPN